MDEQATTELVRTIMTAFAERTGLTGGRTPVRYLWPDAFAMCNFLELERRTKLLSLGEGSRQDRPRALHLCAQIRPPTSHVLEDEH